MHPVDYSRTRLATDVSSDKNMYSGLVDGMKETAADHGESEAKQKTANTQHKQKQPPCG